MSGGIIRTSILISRDISALKPVSSGEWAVEYCAEPQIEWLVDSIPTTAGTVFIGVMGVLIIIDCSNSVAAVYKLNLRLKEISEISEKMYNSSQKLGKALADTAITAV